jgi:hypothetical protein
MEHLSSGARPCENMEISEVAAIMGRNRNSIRRKIRNGTLPGGRILYESEPSYWVNRSVFMAWWVDGINLEQTNKKEVAVIE